MRQGRHVLVAPCVATDLVSFGIHALNNGGITGAWIIDLAFAIVVANNKERGLDIVCFEDIEQITCPNVRSIVESERYVARSGTMVDCLTIW